MLLKKENLLKKYHEFSIKALECLQSEHPDQIEDWLNRRQQLIDEIDGLDQEQGTILTNDAIKEQIGHILIVDSQLRAMMQELKIEAAEQIREIKVGKQLQSRYYDNDGPTAEGIFYDRRK